MASRRRFRKRAYKKKRYFPLRKKKFNRGNNKFNTMAIKVIVYDDITISPAASGFKHWIPWFKFEDEKTGDIHAPFEDEPRFKQAIELFDLFKVTGVKMNFRPNEVTTSLHSLYKVDDINSKQELNLIETLSVQYESYKQLSVKHQWSKYIRLWKNLKTKGLNWSSTKKNELLGNPDLPEEYLQLNVWGGTQISAELQTAAVLPVTIGRLTLTWYIKFKATKPYLVD